MLACSVRLKRFVVERLRSSDDQTTMSMTTKMGRDEEKPGETTETKAMKEVFSVLFRVSALVGCKRQKSNRLDRREAIFSRHANTSSERITMIRANRVRWVVKLRFLVCSIQLTTKDNEQKTGEVLQSKFLIKK